MIIVSRTILSKPEDTLLEYLGENGQGHVYKTDDLSAVSALNEEATISVIPSNKYAELRKTLWAAIAIDRETQNKIRSKYSLEEELAALRTNDQEYREFIAQVISEHNASKDALFLI